MNKNIKIIENIINDESLVFDKSLLERFLTSYKMFIKLSNVNEETLKNIDIESKSMIELLKLILKDVSIHTKVGLDDSSLRLFIKSNKSKLNSSNGKDLSKWYKTILNVK